MNISSRCEYALRAVLELAAHGTAEPLTSEVIAERRHIPDKFLVHILLQLKRHKIVRSVRGARGGYLLARSPEEITLLDVIRAVEGPVLESLPLKGPGSEDFIDAWRSTAQEVGAVLSATTVRNIMDRAASGTMFYI